MIPSKQELLQAAGKKVSDIIAPNLEILFCGINPGLYSAAVGHHFARPGNRFWKALYYAGLTNRLYGPFEDTKILNLGLGITNLVDRSTASAAELKVEEFTAGRTKLEGKIKRFKPKVIAFLGVGAYRSGFQRPKAQIGLQAETIGETKVWVLPNPSGLNAHFTAEKLGEVFSQLKSNKNLGEPAI